MNQVTTQFIAAVPVTGPRACAARLVEQVLDMVSTFDCQGIWARAAGRHVIVGIDEDEAFARITPVGESAYGLAFRATSRECALDAEGAGSHFEASRAPASASRWAPLLLIDGLADVVEHALIGQGAIPRRAACM